MAAWENNKVSSQKAQSIHLGGWLTERETRSRGLSSAKELVESLYRYLCLEEQELGKHAGAFKEPRLSLTQHVYMLN